MTDPGLLVDLQALLAWVKSQNTLSMSPGQRSDFESDVRSRFERIAQALPHLLLGGKVDGPFAWHTCEPTGLDSGRLNQFTVFPTSLIEANVSNPDPRVRLAAAIFPELEISAAIVEKADLSGGASSEAGLELTLRARSDFAFQFVGRALNLTGGRITSLMRDFPFHGFRISTTESQSGATQKSSNLAKDFLRAAAVAKGLERSGAPLEAVEMRVCVAAFTEQHEQRVVAMMSSIGNVFLFAAGALQSLRIGST